MKKWWKSEYFSIPNLLGYFRILLIPLYLVLYYRAETSWDYFIAALIIGISGLTDFLDGFIARKFNMITEFGKILDPIADKLTQGALALSLTLRYPLMTTMLLLFLLKESFMGIMGIVMLKKGKKMDGAQWYGKVCTAVLYIVMFLLILFPNISILKANILILFCLIWMMFSLISYIIFYYRLHKNIIKKDGKAGKKMRYVGCVLVVVAYLILGATIPYVNQPDVSKKFKENIEVDNFYSEQISPDRAMIIKENELALDERIRMIAEAKESIIFSTFAFQSDAAGKDMLAALLDAANRGVDIKLLADGFNSCLYMEYNPYFYVLSSMPNVEIKIYNKVKLLTPWTAMGRMHDKYVIADDNVYILGGRNTFNYFLGDYGDYKNHDWDVLVYNTKSAEGESSIGQLKQYFYDIWDLKMCKKFHDSEKLAKRISVKKAERELVERYKNMKEQRPELFQEYDYVKYTLPTNKITLLSNPTGVYPKEPTVFYTLSQLMKRAKEEVYIHTPYVICNDMMYQAFYEIAEKVPNTKLLTNSAVNNGNLFAAGDYLMNKDKLLQTGMDILEYEGGTSYHGKSMIVDDNMSIVGSFNMDMRSVYLDTELMLAIHSEGLNTELRDKMNSYEDKAMQAIDLESYEPKEGIEKQDMPFSQHIKIKCMRFLVGWARFLL